MNSGGGRRVREDVGGRTVLASPTAERVGFGWLMTTRLGWDDDPLADVARLRAACGGEWEGLAVGRQVHGVRVERVGTVKGLVRFPDTDGLVTSARGAALGVLTADCGVLALWHPPSGALGLAHCGWRSVAGDIPGELLASMAENFGAAPPDMYAVLSPCVCGRCYEVGTDVARAVESAAGTRTWRPLGGGKALLDLAAAVAARLARAGLPAGRMELPRLCTACDSALFHSWRRERSRGRMLTLVWRKD